MGDIASTLTHDGIERTGTLYLPSGYDPVQTYPLVVLLHGGGGDGLKVLEQTSFRQAADANDLIVLAPDGTSHNWSDGRGTTDSEVAGVDDVGFIRACVAKLLAEMPIDPARVYAVGVSNGGIMCFRLACECADIFVAVAPVIASIASLISGGCAPSLPVSVMCIQGTNDPFIPIDGGDTHHKTFSNLGDGGLVDSAEATRLRFAALNGCNPNATVTKLKRIVRDRTSVTHYHHGDGTAGAVVDYYIVDGMGHCWPPEPAEKPAIMGKTSGNIDATATIVEWLSGRSR